MEIIGKIENFSFYNTKENLYCNVSILETRVADINNPQIEEFKKFKKGQALPLKYVLENPQAIIPHLTGQVLRCTVYDTEENKDPRTKQISLKYLFSNFQDASFFGNHN